MSSAADTLEVRIRERAYHIWEASGRPPGRDQEFWHRAREQITVNGDLPKSGAQARQPQAAQAARPPRKRSRKTSG
jgi:hypothetical protein